MVNHNTKSAQYQTKSKRVSVVGGVFVRAICVGFLVFPCLAGIAERRVEC